MNKLLKGIFVTMAISLSLNAQAGIVVIINKDNPNEVSPARLKQLFTLRKSEFEDGQVAKLYLPTEEVTRNSFLSGVLFYSEQRLTRRYEKMEKTGKGTAPINANEADILAAVIQNPNAIGVVKDSLVTDEVRVIAVADLIID